MSQLGDKVASFSGRVDKLRNCCARVEVQHSAGKLNTTDVELVYSSSFLAICCQWEGLLEDALLEVVCGPPSRMPGRKRHAIFSSRKKFKDALLHPNKNYIGLENLKKATALAEMYVPQGRPFSEVSQHNRTLLEHTFVIRNAIAHQTDFAMKKFRESVPGVAALYPSRRSPGAFLRHVFRTAPSQNRFDLYALTFKAASLEIGSAW